MNEPRLEPEQYPWGGLWDEEENFLPNLVMPSIVDYELTSKCYYKCQDCWGAQKDQYWSNSSEMMPDQWWNITRTIREYEGADRVVLTGGEPLLYKRIARLAYKLSNMGIKVDLSTTGMDSFDLLRDVIGSLDHIGVPIDGPDAETNALWRNSEVLFVTPSDILRWAIQTIEKAQKAKDLNVTVRTLIHERNWRTITAIPEMLALRGINIATMRWKCYQRTAVNEKGYRRAAEDLDMASIENEIYEAGADFKEVEVISAQDYARRHYFIVAPNGDSRIVLPANWLNGVSIEEPVGNMAKDAYGVVEELNVHHPKAIAHMNETAYDWSMEKAFEGGYEAH